MHEVTGQGARPSQRSSTSHATEIPSTDVTEIPPDVTEIAPNGTEIPARRYGGRLERYGAPRPMLWRSPLDLELRRSPPDVMEVLERYGDPRPMLWRSPRTPWRSPPDAMEIASNTMEIPPDVTEVVLNAMEIPTRCYGGRPKRYGDPRLMLRRSPRTLWRSRPMLWRSPGTLRRSPSEIVTERGATVFARLQARSSPERDGADRANRTARSAGGSRGCVPPRSWLQEAMLAAGVTRLLPSLCRAVW